MRKEIILPPHLYDRIRASAGEHGGIGTGMLFSDPEDASDGWRFGTTGTPVCAHAHAWGTCTRYNAAPEAKNYRGGDWMSEPELKNHLTWQENDEALRPFIRPWSERVSFERWCEILNVKRGVESPRVEAVAPALDRELAFDPSVAVQ